MKKNLYLIIILLLSTFQLHGLEIHTKVEVLYFHATLRCHGCLTIEENINKSINNLFEEQLKDSVLTSSSLDFLQPENEHYQDDYKFDSQTLILSLKKNGKEVKWKNLDKIWDYYSDFPKFQEYIKEEINAFLKEI